MSIAQPTPHLPTVEDLDDARRVVGMIRGLLPRASIVVVDLGSRIHSVTGEPHVLTSGAGIGCPIAEALHPHARDAVEGHYWAALSGHSTSYEWASPDGGSDHILSFSPLASRNGAVIGATMIAQDVGARSHTHRRLERRARQQTVLAELGNLALQGVPAEELMQRAARAVETTLGADVAAVLPYAATGGLRVRAVSGDTALAPPRTVAPARTGLVMDHMREEEGPVAIADLRDSLLRAPSLEAEGMISLIVAPIGAPRDRYGLLGACSRTRDAFREEDLAFLQLVANTLAGAVERGRSADEVLRREAQVNEAQRLSGVGSWEINLDTGTATASDHLREMIGAGSGALDMDDLYARVHTDDVAWVRRYAKAGAKRNPAPVEFRIIAPRDGAIRLVRSESTGVRVDERGERVMRGTLQDVTEARRAEEILRRSEERFRQGFDNAPIGMTLVDPQTGRYLRANDTYCRLVGRTFEELSQLTYADVAHPDQDETEKRDAYFQGDAGQMVTELRYQRPDGTTVWASVSSSRVMGPDGTVDVLYSQVVDITERRAHEDAVRRDVEAVAWLKEISAALAEDRFELHGQPIVDLRTGETIQHELLLRMRSAAGELIAPGEFLPVAEQYGLIRDIDRWVISRGAEIAASGMEVEINLSGTSMGDVGAIEDIDRALERTGADPSSLVFEITETAAIENVATARALAEGLRRRGCRFALDDFGTGFAGMSSLKALPLDYLKIDREFVKDLCRSDADRHVLVATIDLARAFGLQTIAEGVEDQQTVDLLRELGVDHAQGYFLGRPAPLAV